MNVAPTETRPLSDGAAPTVPARITPRAWWTLWVLAAIYVFANMDRVALSVLLQPIKAELHLSDQQLGLLSGLAFALFHSIFAVPIARIADRTARAKLIAICTAAWSVMMALTGMARNFAELFLARVGVGIGEAGCVPASHSLLADYFPRERRALSVALFQCGAVLGGSGGLFLVGLLAEKYGWRASLQIVGVAGLPVALLAYLTLREGVRVKGAPPPTTESARQALRALLSRPAFVHIAIANGLCSLCTTGMAVWLPTFMIRSFGFSLAEAGGWVGLVSGLSAAAGLVSGGLVTGWLMKRDPRWEVWLPIVANSIAIPLYALSFLSPTPWLVLGIKAFAQYSSAMAAGVGFAAMQSFSEPHRRATSISLVLFLMSLLGTGGGPYLIGLTSDLLAPQFGQESLRYGLVLSLTILAWSVAHFMLAARRYTRDRVN
jgi:MFS family permease